MIELMAPKTTRRLSIATQFLIITLSVLLLAMAVTFFVFYELAKHQALNIGDQALTSVPENAVVFIDAMNQRVKAGDMKLEAAQEIVRIYLQEPKHQHGLRDSAKSKIPAKDYMWAMYPDGTMAMHPFNQAKQDSWQNPGKPVYTFIISPEYYAPWDWIAGAGEREEVIYTNRLAALKYTFLGVTVLMFSIACCFILFFSRRLIHKSGNVNTINEAGQGIFQQNIHFSIKDEFKVLADTVNSKVSDLQSLYGERIPFYSIYDESEQYLQRLSESESRMLKMVNQRIISAQEEERKRLARDLHDRIGQALYSVAVAVKLANRDSHLSEPTRKYIKDVETTMLQAIAELKSIINGMRPASLEESGLLPTIKSYISSLEAKWNIEIILHDHTKVRRYPAEIEIAVYRVFQEALINAIKYAQSDKITVHVHDSRNRLEMVIQDFGIGFNVADQHPGTGGFGLYGMSERMLLLNGLFEIDSEAGMGTKIRLSVPLPED